MEFAEHNWTGINLRCIGLASRDQSALSKVVKLDQVGYYTRLLDLHRSNPFALNFAVINDEIHLPEAWYGLFYILC